MLRDYEVELLDKMVKEEQYQNNIALATFFVVDLLYAYKQTISRVEQLEKEGTFQIETIYSFSS